MILTRAWTEVSAATAKRLQADFDRVRVRTESADQLTEPMIPFDFTAWLYSSTYSTARATAFFCYLDMTYWKSREQLLAVAPTSQRAHLLTCGHLKKYARIGTCEWLRDQGCYPCDSCFAWTEVNELLRAYLQRIIDRQKVVRIGFRPEPLPEEYLAPEFEGFEPLWQLVMRYNDQMMQLPRYRWLESKWVPGLSG